MLAKVVIVLVLLVALLAGIAMLLPREVHVERQAVIASPPATVFALVDGFKQFNAWSPWYALDPGATYTLEGPEFGVGARQSWSGNPKTVGSGRQEIIEVKPYALVRSRLEIDGQGPAATVRFALAPEGTGTKVTWSLDTDMGAGPAGRLFGLLMDRFVGPDYERGLAGLKSLAESLPQADFAGLDVAKVDIAPVPIAYVATQSGKDEAEIAATIGAAYGRIGTFMKAHGLEQAGPPITINTSWDDSGYVFDAAIPLSKLPETEWPADSPVRIKSTYAGKALKVVVRGPHGGLPAAYDQLAAYMAARGDVAAGPPWDSLISDPGSTPEAEWITHIIQPVR